MNVFFFNRRATAAAVIFCGLASAGTISVRAGVVSESFDYPSEQVELFSGRTNRDIINDGGTGWAMDVGWGYSIWGNLATHGGHVAFQIVHPGSLEAPNGLAQRFPSAGGKLLNNTENLILTGRRSLDVEAGPLSIAGLPRLDEVPGRAVPTIGAGGKSVWLAALAKPGHDSFGTWLKLMNSSYGAVSADGGLVFLFDGFKFSLSVSQDWSRLNSTRNAPGRASAPLEWDGESPVLLVAKIDFGPNWGGDTPFANLDIKSFDPFSVPTDGLVTVWINPDLSAEPQSSQAILSVPIFEFRFDAVAVRLGMGAAIDELRLAPSFQELLKN